MCQKPGHLAARLGCAETKVATWDDLAFKLIILEWNVKHRMLQNVDPCDDEASNHEDASYSGTGYSLKDKNEAKPDKTEHGFGKSAKN
ncbi:hypothetical protein Tco_0296818 [Tanacetum coccineum]